MQPSE